MGSKYSAVTKLNEKGLDDLVYASNMSKGPWKDK